MRRFLERQVPPAGTKEARFMELRSVDDFLAFDTVRWFAMTREIPLEIARTFQLEWLKCSNFIVHRAAELRRSLASHA